MIFSVSQGQPDFFISFAILTMIHIDVALSAFYDKLGNASACEKLHDLKRKSIFFHKKI